MSEQWTAFAKLDPESPHGRRIRKVLQTTNFESIKTSALSIRAGMNATLPRNTTCSIDTDTYTSGCHHVVLELRFSDGMRWIVRIKTGTSDEVASDIEKAMLSEIATIQHVRRHTSIPAPEVYGYEVALWSAPNASRCRYMLMEALPGKLLHTRFARSVPADRQPAFVAQFASYYYQLHTMRFASIGSPKPKEAGEQGVSPHVEPLRFDEDSTSLADTHGSTRDMSRPVSTSLDYFSLIRREQTLWVKAEHPNDAEWTASAKFLEQAVPAMVHPKCLNGPFPLCHPDMHYNNMLVDDDYIITGILDWSDSSTGPTELFAASPEFQTYPGISDEANAPILTFRTAVAAEVRRLASEANDELGLVLAELIESPRAELVYRCGFERAYRTKVDAGQALRLLRQSKELREDFGRLGLETLMTVGKQ